MLALKIVPDALTRLRSAKSDHIASMIAGAAETLNCDVSLEALLPLRNENLPLR
jgi:hypothetical protein